MHTLAHTRARTYISSSIANLTASWYFIKIKYSEPNISTPAAASPSGLGGGELPVFVVRHHAPNRDACTVTVRDEYMYRATPSEYT